MSHLWVISFLSKTNQLIPSVNLWLVPAICLWLKYFFSHTVCCRGWRAGAYLCTEDGTFSLWHSQIAVHTFIFKAENCAVCCVTEGAKTDAYNTCSQHWLCCSQKHSHIWAHSFFLLALFLNRKDMSWITVDFASSKHECECVSIAAQCCVPGITLITVWDLFLGC